MAGETPTQELVDCFEMKNGALPVTYDDETHETVTINENAKALGYGEDDGDNPYANRDERFYKTILYNGANFGVATDYNDEIYIDTYVGGGQGFHDDVSLTTPYTCTGYYGRKGRSVKYYSPRGLGNGVAMHKIFFRLAEAYLNLAESLCELNDLDGALDALNVIRNRANQPDLEDVPGYEYTQDYIRERIRNERRVEFCMEDLRFHDQRRWDILGETNKVVTGMRITQNIIGTDTIYSYNRVNVYDRQSYTDKYLIMPICETEAKKLPSLEQPEAWR
jgi:hypothetical protein